MLKVVTWNVNSVQVRLERLLALLERGKPDVVMLQELKCTEDKFPFEAIGNAGYSAEVFGQKTYNGVALLSRLPLKDVKKGMEPFFEDTAARVIQGTLGKVRLVCCYVPNGQQVGCDKFEYKLKWLSGLNQLVQHYCATGTPLILGGDFNIAPEDRDVHNPSLWQDKILCSAVERSQFAQLLEWGLEDTFRKHHREEGRFTWWDYRLMSFEKNHGLRIDFILASKNMAKHCTSAVIDREERKGIRPSDHAPVLAEFSSS